MKTKITINAGKANLIAFLYVLPITGIIFVPFWLLFGGKALQEGLSSFTKLIWFILPGILVLHELLHGFTWSFFCKNGFRSIQFGMIWKYITPYAHCKEELPVTSYRLGTIMPFLILGMIPVLGGYVFASGLFVTIGYLNVIASGGDLIMLWLIRKVSKQSKIQDHPNEVGCYIIS